MNSATTAFDYDTWCAERDRYAWVRLRATATPAQRSTADLRVQILQLFLDTPTRVCDEEMSCRELTPDSPEMITYFGVVEAAYALLVKSLPFGQVECADKIYAEYVARVRG